MLKKIFLLSLLVAFSTNLIFAQDGEKLSLAECIDIALSNNYELRVAQMNVQLADKDITSTRASWLPSVNSSFNFGKYIQGPRTVKEDYPIGIDADGNYLLEERNVKIAKTERTSYSASVSLDQHIYDFGRTGSRLRQAKAWRQFYEHNLFNTRNLVIANVKDKYFQVLKAVKLEEVYAEALRHAEENLDYNQTMLDVGLKSQAEIYQAKVNVGNRKTALINQLNVIELAKAALNSAMGINPAKMIDVEEDMPQPIFPTYNFQEAIDIALDKNDRLNAIEQEVKATEYAIRAAKARYAPSIGARLAYDRNNDLLSRVYSADLDEDYTATIGAGINLNIFNGLADKADIQRQQLNNKIALEKLNEEKRLLITQIREYFLLLKAYKDIISINEENLLAYEENLRLQQEKRRVGAGTELEVRQAQVDVIQAQETLVGAKYQAKINRAYLEAALGIIAEEL